MMFSSKKITKVLATILIVLMCMVMVPVAAARNVSAAEPDMENATKVKIHEYVEVEKGSSMTYLLHTTYAMKYRIDVMPQTPEYVDGKKKDFMLYVFDATGKLLASTAEQRMVIELAADKDYYFVLEKAAANYFSIKFNYDYQLDVKKKTAVDSGFKTKESDFMWGASAYNDLLWYTYETDDTSDIKVDFSVGSLPEGMKLSYEWYLDKTGWNKFVSVGKANSELDIKNPAKTQYVYKCCIKSTDGKFSDEIFFKIETEYTYVFADGKPEAYDVKAYRPGEERKFDLPELRYNGDPNQDTSYYLSESFDFNNKYQSSKTPITTIPSNWKASCVYGHNYKSNARVLYLCLSFVFEDGAGEKVNCGNSYHVEKKPSAFNGDYAQVIYSFTPESSGTYRFASSNVKLGYSMCSIFDQDRKVIATSIDGYFEIARAEDYRHAFDIQAELTGGKTYYIAIPIMDRGNTFDFSISQVSVATKEKTFEDFVERLYVVALGRASEPDGKAHWCKVVGNGSYSGADCARFFLTSPEFNGRNLNDEEYLKVLYKTFFDRDAAEDPDGFNFWLSKIGEWGRGRVLEGFIDSTEWCNICADYGVRSGAMTAKATRASKNATAFATRLYTECLGREPEEGGLNYWSLSLTNQERTGTQAAKEFFYSEEFISKGLNDNDYVVRLYKTFMGREPDDAGKAHWINQLSSGAMNRDQVFDFFSTCEEFTDICNSYAIAR